MGKRNQKALVVYSSPAGTTHHVAQVIINTLKDLGCDPGAYNLPLNDLIQYGASPRATIYLTLGAKASAFLGGRGYVTPQDVKDVAMDVMRHRVIVTYEAEAEEKTSVEVVQEILDHVPVP